MFSKFIKLPLLLVLGTVSVFASEPFSEKSGHRIKFQAIKSYGVPVTGDSEEDLGYKCLKAAGSGLVKGSTIGAGVGITVMLLNLFLQHLRAKY